MSELAARLYEMVVEYAAIGAHHRTGTAEDARTLDWFENRLRTLGTKTERQPWSFDRYDAEWSVTVDGADVAARPLFDEGTGEIASTTPLVAAVTATPSERQRHRGIGNTGRAVAAKDLTRTVPVEQPTKFELVINLKSPDFSASQSRSRYLCKRLRSSRRTHQ